MKSHVRTYVKLSRDDFADKYALELVSHAITNMKAFGDTTIDPEQVMNVIQTAVRGGMRDLDAEFGELIIERAREFLP